MSDNIGFLFDLDGVLIDSEREYSRIWGTINEEFPTGVENFEMVIKGRTLTEILTRFFPDKSKHLQIVAHLNEMERCMRYRMLPGAMEMLRELEEMGIPRVMVTSSNDMKMAHLREEQPELEGMFTDIVTADRISRSKPDPEGYLLGARLCGASPERCVVFEDSAQGVMAGRNAGAYVVGLTTTLPALRLRPYSDRIVGDLLDVDTEEMAATLRRRGLIHKSLNADI